MKAGNKSTKCSATADTSNFVKKLPYQLRFALYSPQTVIETKLQHCFFVFADWVVTRKADGGWGEKGVTTKFLDIGYPLLESREEQATIDTIKTLLMWRFTTKVRGNTMQLTSGCWSENGEKINTPCLLWGREIIQDFYTKLSGMWHKTYNQDELKKKRKSSPIISFLAIKKIGHDFILSAIF